jgi:hypothetical protein
VSRLTRIPEINAQFVVGLEVFGQYEDGIAGAVTKFVLGQNSKIGYQKFNDLQTAKLSKKQLCDSTKMHT